MLRWLETHQESYAEGTGAEAGSPGPWARTGAEVGPRGPIAWHKLFALKSHCAAELAWVWVPGD